VINKLQALENEAKDKMKMGNAFYSGQYKAYHKALELVKKAIKESDA
jgi:TPR repeat protein